VILFGGADHRRVRGDTWSWNGTTWRRVARRGPEPRSFASMAFDAARGTVVLFGGNRVLFGDGRGDTFLADTWLLTGSTWRPVAGAGPEPRAESAAAYDPHRGRLVLFGGYRRTAERRERLGDTWEWDGQRWEKVASSGPSPRNGAVMMYDEVRRRIVLFGGSGGAADTWEWDGRSWEERPSGSVPGRYNAAAAWVASARYGLRFGGWTGNGRAGDTWRLDRAGWHLLDLPGPEPRNHAALAYDSRRSRAVLFGGHDGERVFGDTWEWDGERWRRVAWVPPRRRIPNGH
jgi:hypothetical protein